MIDSSEEQAKIRGKEISVEQIAQELEDGMARGENGHTVIRAIMHSHSLDVREVESAIAYHMDQIGETLPKEGIASETDITLRVVMRLFKDDFDYLKDR